MVSKSKVDMTVEKWKDKRSVLMIPKAHIPKMRDILTIYNAHIPKMATVTNRRGNEKQKPNMVKDYNNSMSGINRSDQMLSYHFDLTKNLRWYKKAGVHILEMFLTNAFYLYQKFSTNRDFSHLVDFKENVIKCLIRERKKKNFMESAADFHYLAPISEVEKKKIQHYDVNNVGRTNQGKSHVTFVDTAKITQLFGFIHASVFIIKTLG